MRSSGFRNSHLSMLGLLAALTLAAPVAAQETIRLGETKQGELDRTDLKLDDNSYYDMYKYVGKSGETIQIIMRSGAVDAYISFGQMEGGSFTLLASDDDGAGDHDAKLVVTLPADGVYIVRANSVQAEESGAYTLALSAGNPAEAEALGQPGGAEEENLPEPSPIRIGQTVQGLLTSDDAMMSDSSRYDLYSFAGRSGQHLVITMRSADFDSYLAFGTIESGSFNTLESNDDGAGEKDSQVEYDLPSDSTYVIRANSLFGGATGSYSLTLEEGTPPPPAEVKPIQVGETVTGNLDDSDPKMDDDSYYELWSFTGKKGDQLTITLKSSEFDTYLAFGHMDGREFSSDETDDDGAGGTDSQIQVTLEADGEFVIRANSLSANETGSYTLSLTRGTAGPGAGPGPKKLAPTPQSIRVGQTVTGELSASDATADDDSYYDLYSVTAPQGTKLIITLQSSAFDAYIAWGRMTNGEWDQLDSDDDSGGGTNARLEVTVGDDGTYLIRANTLSPGETGAYTLRVERKR